MRLILILALKGEYKLDAVESGLDQLFYSITGDLICARFEVMNAVLMISIDS
jgi:hypothetical protein